MSRGTKTSFTFQRADPHGTVCYDHRIEKDKGAAVYPPSFFFCVELVLLNHWVPFLSVRSVLKCCTDFSHQT